MNTSTSNVRAIFLAAIEKHLPEERASFLDEACAGNPRLRARVECLLRSHELLGSFHDKPQPLADTADSLPNAEGRIIGPYRLLQQIGEGGMGVVYVAEQSEPVRRKVALKVIKPGLDTRSIIARFEAERQTLALMDHPNVARVLDAGATDAGRPYFVMELVQGIPITEFCDQQKLSVPERLRLFVDVCRAVQHAHQKGIIHRDLKPSNILVTLYDGMPVPKVIDFGISKALSRQLTEETMFTESGQIIGTPLYMSPEQAQMNGLDVDTRSDIYSLGALLYELLTGTPPFDKDTLQNAGPNELRRILHEDEPPRPSLRLSTMEGEQLSAVSDQRRIDRHKLAPTCRRDLDWIVMRALEKDRNRRYESASAFAADIERYLTGDAVVACPPSVLYRLGKFARRHRTALATSMLVIAALTGGLAMSLWQAARATHDAHRATIAEELANRRLQQIDVQRRLAEGNARRADAAAAAERRARQQAVDQRKQATEWAKREQDARVEAEQRLYESEIHRAAGALDAGNYREARWTVSSLPPIHHGWELQYLKRQIAGTPLTLHGHTQFVTSVAFSPDGSLIASGGNDHTVRVWDAHSGYERLVLRGHDVNVSSVTFSPDGRKLLTGSGDKTAKVWDAATGRELLTLQGHTDYVRSAVFSPDGLRIASGSDDGTVRLWDAATGSELFTVDGHDDNVRAVAFSPDGEFIASGSWDKTIKVWETVSGGELLILRGHRNHVTGVTFSPDGQRIASSSMDGVVRIWNATTGRELLAISGAGQNCVAFSPDGRWVAGADHLWDAQTGLRVRTLSGHARQVMGVAFSPDGRRLASASRDETVKVWTSPSVRNRSSCKATRPRSRASPSALTVIRSFTRTPRRMLRPPTTGSPPASIFAGWQSAHRRTNTCDGVLRKPKGL